MAKLRYPRTIWRKIKSESVPTKGCVICGNKENLVAIKETQFNWFRGDDTIEVFCIKCLPSREKRRPENLRM
jgi:hypothetical protein